MDSQGIDTGRYRVVPRTLVFVERDGRWLLVRRPADAAIWPGCYNGVGGHVEAGEDLLSAARREVAEETGLRLQHLRLAGLLHVSAVDAADGVMVVVFTGRVEEGQSGRPDAKLEWFTPTEAEALKVVPDLPAMLPRLDADGNGSPFLAYSTAGREASVRFAAFD